MSAPDSGVSLEPATGNANTPTLESVIPWELVPACRQRLLASTDTYIVARGWPFGAAWCEYQVEIIAFPASDWGPITRGQPRGGVALPGSRTGWLEPVLLPLYPLWPGLIADAAIFGLAWGAALTGVSALRRSRRRRGGRCPECGYDLAGAKSVCPECGSAGER